MINPFVLENKPKKIRDAKLLRRSYQGLDASFIIDANKETLKTTISSRRVAWFFLLIFSVLTVFVFRMFYLQILKNDYWLSAAEGNRIRVEKQVPERGVIFDRNGKVLVENVPNFILSIIPADFMIVEDNQQQLLDFLAAELGDEVNMEKVKQKLNELDSFSYEPIELIDNIPYEKSIDLLLKIKDYSFLRIDYVNSRRYLGEEFGLGHVLGYLGKMNETEWAKFKEQDYLLIDWVGKSGLEKEYEQELRGVVGKYEVEVDALGNVKKGVREQKPIKGQNLILGLDVDLNAVFKKTLCTAADKFGGRAAGVAIDPRNGEILALVSCPNYDNNLFNNSLKNSEQIGFLLSNEKQPMFNRVIQGEYAPGSIFKLLIAATGLQEGVINPRTIINSYGGLAIDKWFFPDWKAGGHGPTNLSKALAESVNTFFYYVGGGYKQDFIGLGMGKIISYAKKIGLGEVTGIDLPGENKGFLPSIEWKKEAAGRDWYIGDTYHLSIGQGDVLLTPLQATTMTSLFAAGGVLYEPHLVKAMVDEKGVVKNVEPRKIKQNIFDEQYVDEVRQGLRQTVTAGSALFLNDLQVTVAGKTGTAQVGGDVEPHAWFTGFAPYEEPEMVITVLIENGVGGDMSAVPVAKQVLQWWIEDRNINFLTGPKQAL